MSSVNAHLEAAEQSPREGARYVHSVSHSPQAGTWAVGTAEPKHQMPRVVRLSAPTVTITAQVASVFTGHFRSLNRFPSRRVVQRRCEVIVTAYNELNAYGYDIRDVSTFGLRHARALLEVWKKKRLSRNTIYCRWSALRTWSNALGKAAMLGRLEEYWPEFKRSDATKQTYHLLTQEQLDQRSAFLRQQPDKTCYLVDRLTRELQMTRELAFEIQLEAVEAVIHGESFLRVGVGGRRKLFPDMGKHAELIQELHQFMVERHRKTLAWTGRDLDGAITKYAARMTYVTKRLFPPQKGGEA